MAVHLARAWMSVEYNWTVDSRLLFIYRPLLSPLHWFVCESEKTQYVNPNRKVLGPLFCNFRQSYYTVLINSSCSGCWNYLVWGCSRISPKIRNTFPLISILKYVFICSVLIWFFCLNISSYSDYICPLCIYRALSYALPVSTQPVC